MLKSYFEIIIINILIGDQVYYSLDFVQKFDPFYPAGYEDGLSAGYCGTRDRGQG